MASVKICGLTSAPAVDAAATADAIGFMFVAASPRALTPAEARPLVARARPPAVGVFADPDDTLIEAALAAGVAILQLHGRESPARVAEIRARFGRPVWKAAGVATAADIAALERSYPMADALLLDARAPAGSPLSGGHGARFDWAILRQARPRRPWILAGGLDPSNVASAIAETGARFVDVSSGVEDAPGAKSLAKIEAFLREARRG
ncbi:phosphoribosylanthranilate isomerase [Thermaurantiacus sp.]